MIIYMNKTNFQIEINGERSHVYTILLKKAFGFFIDGIKNAPLIKKTLRFLEAITYKN